SIKNDGHYFCRAGGNRPDGLNEPVTDEVYRHGHSCSRHERFRCRSCKRVFQLAYSCEVRKPGVKEQSVEMAHNGAGGRDTTRTSR
ncbi:IS1-like element transposase, partial [Escherichia coli]|uniref:IS1-like element transposase n=1 Tax=Escherichia coli TaxID=562 RepID=UPI0034D598B7